MSRRKKNETRKISNNNRCINKTYKESRLESIERKLKRIYEIKDIARKVLEKIETIRTNEIKILNKQNGK